MGLLWGKKKPSKTYLIPAQTQTMRTARRRTVFFFVPRYQKLFYDVHHKTQQCFSGRLWSSSVSSTFPQCWRLDHFQAAVIITARSALCKCSCYDINTWSRSDSALLSVHYIAVNCKSARARLLIWFQCPCTALLFQDYCCLWYRPTSCG